MSKKERNMMIDFNILDELPSLLTSMFVFYLLSKSLDFITGLLKTWKNGNYKSSIMRDGIISWIGELVGITFVLALDFILGLDFYLTDFTIALFVFKEAGSILENLGAIGVELPSIVSEKIELLNKENKDDEK